MCIAESCASQSQKLILFGKAKAKFIPEIAPLGALGHFFSVFYNSD